jgi:hypothetical protein
VRRAVEQLGSDKIEVRLGGIYGLERIAKESADYYWPIMETLTALIRERARWTEPDVSASGSVADFYETVGDIEQTQDSPSPPTVIAAALTVIRRRSDENREREQTEDWFLDLPNTDLRGALLQDAHLEGADLGGAHLENAYLKDAHLEGVDLRDAIGLVREQIERAHGNVAKHLPDGLQRPRHWSSEEEETEPENKRWSARSAPVTAWCAGR